MHREEEDNKKGPGSGSLKVRDQQSHLSIGLSARGRKILSDQHFPPRKGGFLWTHFCNTGNTSIVSISLTEARPSPLDDPTSGL